MKEEFIKRRDYTYKDYAYKRKGSCNVFCIVEPRAGHHLTYVTKNRRGREFAKVIRRIESHYCTAKRIHIVLDNLNTHVRKSLIVEKTLFQSVIR